MGKESASWSLEARNLFLWTMRHWVRSPWKDLRRNMYAKCMQIGPSSCLTNTHRVYPHIGCPRRGLSPGRMCFSGLGWFQAFVWISSLDGVHQKGGDPTFGKGIPLLSCSKGDKKLIHLTEIFSPVSIVSECSDWAHFMETFSFRCLRIRLKSP